MEYDGSVLVAEAPHGLSGVLPETAVGGANAALVGGKAAGLARLRDAGCVTPPWFVIVPSAWEGDELRAAARAGIARELAVLCAGDADATFAVRSSATTEDGVAASYAGQFESELFVTAHEVVEAAARVRASASGERACAYAAERDPATAANGAVAPVAMAVVVQRMVEGDASGVAFGVDPVDGSDVVVIAAAYGLAAGVVDGDCVTDVYRVAPDGRIADREIAVKDRMRVRARGTTAHPGTNRADATGNVAVAGTRRNAPVLGACEIGRIARLVRQISAACGAPQDVEWTFERGRLYALQARPVTAVAGVPDAIWDDSNIAESYGGVTGALTYSFARHAYAGAYRAFFALAAVPERVVARHAEAFDGLVGRVEGRMMYDVVRWYRLLALLPGYRLNRRFMEEMMGVRDALPEAVAATIARETSGSKLADGCALARSAVSLAVAALRLPHAIGAFHAHVARVLAGGPDLERASAAELAREYRRLERELLARWKVPIANDFFVMIAHGLLRRAATRWCGDAPVVDALLSDCGGMRSAEPAHAVGALARMDPHDPAFAVAFASYLERFGDRCESELKLESPTLRDDPAPLLAAIARLRGSGMHVPAATDANAAARRDAAVRLRHAMHGKPVRGLVLRALLAWARARIVARENLRFERTLVFGRVRALAVAMGRELVAAGRLDDARDVFHLTVDELFGCVEGTSASRELRALAAVRRDETARYAAAPPPPGRFATRGIPAAPVARSAAFVAPVATAGGETRRGIACCPGVVRGRVRVVRDPRDTFERGEILVTERTDPSWVVLFPAAAAILVERGSALSHAAIVSRELGIPSVVAIPGVTQWLRDGDEVVLDGSTGVVQRVAERAS